MAGLDAPAEGRIIFEGADVTGVPVQRRSVAMVYQQFINYPNLSVYENIASPLRVAGAQRAEMDKRVRDTAAMMKLTPLLERKPLELSGGQQQRTALARAIVKGAKLVLLDEPLANSTTSCARKLREELPRIFSATGAIFVYATTEPVEALLLGGSTATLSEGRVTQFGPTVEVYRHPNSLQTARIFSDPPINTLPVQKSGRVDRARRPVTCATAVRRHPGRPYTLGFRPTTSISPGRPGRARRHPDGYHNEITGSEVSSTSMSRQSVGGAGPTASTIRHRPTVELFLDPAASSYSTHPGQLAARGRHAEGRIGGAHRARPHLPLLLGHAARAGGLCAEGSSTHVWDDGGA
jgi:glycerol transport system ATP-binding protein